ncbi:AP-1 complex subunit sigma-3 isoform X1 [Nomascus leucogenys]|uniref:AP-1 complex subunit sigma-3 isoform X1 n=1 Tax=Nomascus leucogenys TaxID=61853 RepID=UPI00122D88AA|nr:AP-1 complex subunit sigma-3 isoform X1 [Nomascus leucogenys]
MIHFILLFSRQGKLRLQKWYITLPDKERKKITREVVQIILSRGHRTSSFVDWKELKLVYKRYASLYFCCAIENQDNELLTLEIVHRYVELLDKYFGNVCELDIIFNFEKAYFILDEFIIGGEIQETSKKIAVKAIEDSDMLQENCLSLVGRDCSEPRSCHCTPAWATRAKLRIKKKKKKNYEELGSTCEIVLILHQ